MKSLIINVDDLGLAPAINQAVIELAQLQRIHSTSFMSLGNIEPDDVKTLQKQSIEIGLHFDLTGLAQQGSLKQIILRSWLRRWPKQQLTELIERQLDAFEDKIGTTPVFIDGHQHVHQFPQIREALISTIHRRYGYSIAWRNTQPLIRDAKSQIVYSMGGRFSQKLIQKSGLGSNAIFGGVYDFQANIDELSHFWTRWLSASPHQGTVIMCHPALPNYQWQDEIKTARELEWQLLSSDQFGQILQQFNIQGQSWRDFKI